MTSDSHTDFAIACRQRKPILFPHFRNAGDTRTSTWAAPISLRNIAKTTSAVESQTIALQ